MSRHGIHRILAQVAILAASLPILVLGHTAKRRPPKVDQQSPDTKIRTRVSLVNTPVTALNAKGEIVSNLESKDFRLTDNGAPQKIIYFDVGNMPVSMVILIEAGSRIAPLLSDIRKTGIIFAEAVLGPEDEAAVVRFDDSVENLTDFTADRGVIETTINNLKPGIAGSNVFDAMAYGVEMLNRLKPTPTADSPDRRRVLLVMSEDADFGNQTRLDAILQRAQLANVTIYSIGIWTTLMELKSPTRDDRHWTTPKGIFPQPMMPGTIQTPTTEDTRYGYGNLVTFMRDIRNQIAPHALQIAASRTGGQYIPTFKSDAIERAVDEIGGELRSQYSLGYQPTGVSVPGFHEIKVRVDRKGVKARTRRWYYVLPPES
jgi:VWFA-related protein